MALRYFYPEADGSFGVGKEMSRAEFTVVLCRALGWIAVVGVHIPEGQGHVLDQSGKADAPL